METPRTEKMSSVTLSEAELRSISKGSDCGNVLDVRDAYVTEFNDGGGNGAALIIQIAVENRAYTKNIYVKPTDQGPYAKEERAQSGRPYYEAIATSYYDGNEGSLDRFTVLDQRIGPSRTHGFNIAVEMNGQTYTCSNVVVGQ
jgi:hypothetical protein